MEENLIGMLEELLDVEEGTLTGDTELDTVEEWDSIAKLALMAEVKKNWQRSLTVEEIKNFRFVKDICEYLK